MLDRLQCDYEVLGMICRLAVDDKIVSQDNICVRIAHRSDQHIIESLDRLECNSIIYCRDGEYYIVGLE